jgi:hypothetical protein
MAGLAGSEAESGGGGRDAGMRVGGTLKVDVEVLAGSRMSDTVKSGSGDLTHLWHSKRLT